jgi:rhodanese-related sulfurtransferase
MNIRWQELGTNVKLGIGVVVLALIGLLVGESYKNRGVSIDPKELSYIIQNELDHVRASELATWIMQGRADFRIIDLRDSTAFRQYHIPGAQNLSLPSLVGTRFAKNESIVLYSEGGVHSAQAMFLLWAQGYKKVFMLKGGMKEWEDEVLHPTIETAGVKGMSLDSLETLRRISIYFGGTPKNPAPIDTSKQQPARERERGRVEC